MRPRDFVDYPVYLLVRMLICAIQSLRLETCASLARSLATLLTYVLKIRHTVVDDNLRHAFPEMSSGQRRDLIWRMWEHLLLMMFEVMHAPRKIHCTNWRDYIRLSDAKRLILAVFDDRPSVLVSGHYGNFELSGYMLGLLGFPSFTVARTLDNRFLDRYLNAFRGLSGQYILPKSGSADQAQQIMANGGILALLGDQNAGPKGCWVEFFGRPASSHKAIALFTLGNEAPTVFCFIRRRCGGKPLCHHMGIGDVIDPRAMDPQMRSVPDVTRWYTQLLERTIRVAPEQYWWIHRRWKDTRPKKSPPAANKAA